MNKSYQVTSKEGQWFVRPHETLCVCACVTLRVNRNKVSQMRSSKTLKNFNGKLCSSIATDRVRKTVYRLQ